MRRAFLIVMVLGIIAAVAVREVRLHRKVPLETAYVGAQGATLWNGTAEVRTPVANLSYGEPVQVYQRDGEHVLVRTKAGVQGWVSAGSLLSIALWQSAELLDKRTASMPVQARGHTRARSNLHMRPGRQWEVIATAPGDTPVEMFERQAVANPKRQMRAGSGSGPRMEDWWLVRASMENSERISGWMLGRFASLDLPEPLPEYESSEGIGIVAWFAINRAVDSTGAVKPEYLVMGTRAGEGRPCDFTLIRVYTWSPVRHRYETAFMERGLCGSLPVETTPATRPGGDARFGFRNAGPNGTENRMYEMKLTTVRRIDARAPGGRKGKRR
ncbi:MAG: SH3 domain-containing protein [Candidatus Acidiferrales bacterium]